MSNVPREGNTINKVYQSCPTISIPFLGIDIFGDGKQISIDTYCSNELNAEKDFFEDCGWVSLSGTGNNKVVYQDICSCPSNTYENANGECVNVTRCSMDTEFTAKDPTSTSDAVCCSLTQYYSDNECKDLTTCTNEQFEAVEKTSTSDRKCCNNEQYLDPQTNECSNCAPSEYITTDKKHANLSPHVKDGSIRMTQTTWEVLKVRHQIKSMVITLQIASVVHLIYAEPLNTL